MRAKPTDRPRGSSGDYEVIPVPDTLRRKALILRGSLQDALAEAVARAEAAVEGLSGDFDRWMADEVGRLTAAHRTFRQAPGPETRSSLFKAAHDLRGQAALLGYPLAGRICGSLARLLGARVKVPQPLVDQHVEAVRAMVREGVRDAGDPVGLALAAELERLTQEILTRNFG